MGHIHFSKKILSNGLTVIHHFDPGTPFVVINLLYKVGSRNEQSNKTGFAHLFEHLMFEGTPAIPYFDGPLQDAGGENNAFTNNDYTNYYDIVPYVNAELPFWMEADRMANLAINTHSLSVQRKVVIEEFKESCINQPYGDAWHHLRKIVYKQHPYRWPTIGKSLSHIKNATLSDVKAFFHQYYVPNNAILVVAGQMEEKEAFEYAEKWFGPIPANDQLTDETYFEPEQTAARKKKVIADVPQHAVYLAFPMPGRLEDGYYEADILTDILTTGSSSRMYQELVKKKGLFTEIEAYISGSNDTGMFVIEGKVAEQKEVSLALEGIWNALRKVANELIETAELDKVKNKTLTYMNFSDASLLNRSISLAYYEMIGDAHLINEEERKYEAITPESIRTFASQYLIPQKSNLLLYLSQSML